jgi:hypothetical protein
LSLNVTYFNDPGKPPVKKAINDRKWKGQYFSYLKFLPP